MKRYNQLSEAVQRPENYLQLIYETLEKNKNKIINSNLDSVIDFCNKFNFILKKFKIKLNQDLSNKKSRYLGLTEDAEMLFDRKNTIIVYCNNDILSIKDKKNYYIFITGFLDIVGHEIVHRLQINRIKEKEILNILSTKEIENQKEFLSNKQEMMAYAWQIIQEFRALNYNDNEILKVIKADWKYTMSALLPRIYFIYLNVFQFNKENKVLKRLHKYMYEYLT